MPHPRNGHAAGAVVDHCRYCHGVSTTALKDWLRHIATPLRSESQPTPAARSWPLYGRHRMIPTGYLQTSSCCDDRWTLPSHSQRSATRRSDR